MGREERGLFACCAPSYVGAGGQVVTPLLVLGHGVPRRWGEDAVAGAAVWARGSGGPGGGWGGRVGRGLGLLLWESRGAVRQGAAPGAFQPWREGVGTIFRWGRFSRGKCSCAAAERSMC